MDSKEIAQTIRDAIEHLKLSVARPLLETPPHVRDIVAALRILALAFDRHTDVD